MILLIVDESADNIAAILDTLKKGGGSHQVHTASGLDTARKAAAAMPQLDVLIATSVSSEGESGFELRDELRKRFPDLQTAFTNEYDLSDWQQQVGHDPVFGKPPDEAQLLEWARSVGISTIPADTTEAPAAESVEESEPLMASSVAPATPRTSIPLPVTDEDDADEDELPVAETISAPGKRLGDYELLRLLGGDGRTETHEATQMSIDRKVALVLLKPEFAGDRESIRDFRGLVRARAKVSHPNITPVYEGYEEGGALFFTRELVDGPSVRETITSGKTITGEIIVDAIKVTAETMHHLETEGIHHDLLEPKHIYLGRDGRTRVANIAALEPVALPTPEQQIRVIGAEMAPLKPTHLEGPAAELLASMVAEDGPSDWHSLQGAATAAEERLAESATYNVTTKLTRGGGARRWLVGAAIALVAIAIIFAVTLKKVTPPEQRDLDGMLRIAGGEFIYQNGETATVPTFWIDQYEVTIGDYADFIAALGAPETKDFNHPDQPEEKKRHRPEIWDDLYDAATRGVRYEDKLVDLNCPMTNVDWWDAYAFAKWKKRRLPTEEEWEKAGRGKDGALFPWGEAMDPSKLVSNDPAYEAWKPVDGVPGDRSHFEVAGLAGNVSEWTATWEDHPELFDVQVPVLRGGSFLDDPKSPSNLTRRKTVNDPTDKGDDIGFRTVSDTDPALGGS